MELMSSLLLYAFAALLPQALGLKTNNLTELTREVPTLLTSHNKLPTSRKTFWLRLKIPSESTIRTVLQYLQAEGCSMCIKCIHSASPIPKKDTDNNLPLYAVNTAANVQHMHSRDHMFNDVIENYDQYKLVRNKRGTDTTTTKSKRNQMSISKNVTVNKYYIDGQVYALKSWEKNSTKAGVLDGQSCHVYSVKKNYPCDSSQAELIFKTAKRKANKRSKKQARVALRTGKPPATEKQVTPTDKVLAESFMTSIEELYN